MSQQLIHDMRGASASRRDMQSEQLSLMCELLTLLEDSTDPGLVGAFLGRMATGFGFDVAAAFFSDDGHLESAQLRVLVGGELDHWGQTQIPEALAHALRLRSDRPVALKARPNGRLAFDQALPHFRGQNWSGLALQLTANNQVIGAVVFGGPDTQLQSRLHESVLVRLIRALSRSIHALHTTHQTRNSTPNRSIPNRLASKKFRKAAQLEGVFSSIGNAIVVADLNRYVVAMNPAAEEITGWTEAEAIGKALDFVVQMVSDPYNQSQRPHPGPHAVRWLLVRKDGSKRPIEGGITPLKGRKGVNTGFIANLKDDRQNRNVERALIRTKEEQRFLVERLPIGVLILQGTTITFANPAWRDFLQVPFNEALVGQSIHGLLHPEDQAFVVARNRSAERTVGPLPPGEFRFVRGDGRYASIELFKAQMVEFEGMLSTLIVGADVTETRIMQAKLETSERMASVGTLAAGVAHEINNPLTYVMTNLNQLTQVIENANLILPKRLKEEVGSHLTEAKDGATRVCEIVRDLKNLSKGDDETIMAVDVIEVVNAAANMASNEIRHRARLERAFEDVPPIAANPRRLAQVFINLLVNAAQAIGSGRANEHTVGVRVLNGPDRSVIVEIWDDGPGMSEEVQQRIFEPFYTTKSEHGGVGLGLPICHSIIEGFGGQINVSSALNQGTCFRLTLPALANDSATFDLQHAANSSEPQTLPQRADGLQLLVVDDEPLVARALQRMLREHNVEIAHNGADALKKCRKQHYDAIFCDVMMPQMNGLQLLTMLRELYPQVASKLVFMSGGVFDPEVAHQVAETPNPMVEKPFVSGQIHEAIRFVTETP